MNEVPKIAKARLAAQKPVEPHPDADLLTAFAEQGLRGNERESMLTHLAACSVCREVVALAAPEQDIAMPVPAGGGFRERSFLGLSLLRWSAVAACVVVIASMAVINQRIFSDRSTVAILDGNLDKSTGTNKTSASENAQRKNLKEPAKAASDSDQLNPLSKPVPAIPKPAATPATAGIPVRNKDAEFQAKTETLGKGRADTAQFAIEGSTNLTKELDASKKSGTSANEIAQQRAGYNALKQQPGGAAQSQLATVGGIRDEKSSGVVGGTINHGFIAGAAGSAANNSVGAGNYNGAMLNANRATSGPTGNTANNSIGLNAVNAPAPSVAASDALQAEAKKQKTANNITAMEVTAESPVVETTPASSTSQLKATPPALIGSGLKLKDKVVESTTANYRMLAGGRLIALDVASQTWHPLEITPNFKVRALAERADGEVWVGGKDDKSSTALYHSKDGKKWIKVEGGWSGDIIQLMYTSATEISLTTSNSQTWKSADGGKTWKKH